MVQIFCYGVSCCRRQRHEKWRSSLWTLLKTIYVVMECWSSSSVIMPRSRLVTKWRTYFVPFTFLIGRGREPGQQHQIPAKCRYQTVKKLASIILNHLDSPAYLWLLCRMYISFLLNNICNTSMNGSLPIQTSLTDSTKNVSLWLSFQWYEPLVCYTIDDSKFPSNMCERHGHWVGIIEHVGHATTFKMLTN